MLMLHSVRQLEKAKLGGTNLAKDLFRNIISYQNLKIIFDFNNNFLLKMCAIFVMKLAKKCGPICVDFKNILPQNRIFV